MPFLCPLAHVDYLMCIMNVILGHAILVLWNELRNK